VSPSPSFSSSPPSRDGSWSCFDSSMAEDEDAADTLPPPPMQKRVLSRSHGSRVIPGKLHDDLPPVPSNTVRDNGPPSGDRHCQNCSSLEYLTAARQLCSDHSFARILRLFVYVLKFERLQKWS
jgi:hypothetical protein